MRFLYYKRIFMMDSITPVALSCTAEYATLPVIEQMNKVLFICWHDWSCTETRKEETFMFMEFIFSSLSLSCYMYYWVISFRIYFPLITWMCASFIIHPKITFMSLYIHVTLHDQCTCNHIIIKLLSIIVNVFKFFVFVLVFFTY